MIVVRIAGDDSWNIGWNSHDGQAPYLADDSDGRQTGSGKALGELLARQHVEQLGHQYRAAAQLENLRHGVIE